MNILSSVESIDDLSIKTHFDLLYSLYMTLYDARLSWILHIPGVTIPRAIADRSLITLPFKKVFTV
jgi:hypothetical protein